MVDPVARVHSLYYYYHYYDVLNLIEIEQPRQSYSQFGNFLLELRLAVTLTFHPLTLNFCGISGVVCRNPW